GFTIEDQGIGMTAQETAQIFERFWRADKSGKHPGAGLGMSIVKDIVALHGGRIVIASMPARGTRVTVWLPAAA
ncbi:MAG: sensor histidine kinase, partial [Proteobacteria bacterium]|nr:sensor histidine kinase [Pseudomonadota bacterium]